MTREMWIIAYGQFCYLFGVALGILVMVLKKSASKSEKIIDR